MRLRIPLRSLRRKIIVWTFIPTMLILVAVAVIIFHAYQDVTRDLVIERTQYRARLTADQVGAGLAGYAGLLETEARKAAIYTNVRAAQQDTLARDSGSLTAFGGGVMILDRTGTVVASAPERPDVMGEDWSDRPCFRYMLHPPGPGPARPFFSDIATDGLAGGEVVLIAVPITSPVGEFTGVMTGMFRLDQAGTGSFQYEVVQPHLGDNVEAYLVNSAGRAIYHSDPDATGDDLSSQKLVQHVLAGGAGSTLVSDSDGRTVLAISAPIPGTSWELVTLEDWGALISPGRVYRQFLALLLALGVIVPVLVVTFGLRQAIKPIEDLTRATQEVARGNFQQRISAPTGDELETLANQFNLMAAQLQESYARLEQKVTDRTRELSTLLDISRNVVSTHALSPLLGVILDQLKSVVDYDGASILTLDGESLQVLAYRGPIPEDEALKLHFPLQRARVNEEVIRRKRPVIIADVLGDTSMARSFREAAGDELQSKFGYVRSWMGVPLALKGRVMGMLSFDHSQPDRYQPAQAGLAQAFASQVAVTIENARLYEETRRLEDEIQTFFNVQQAVAGPLRWEAVLQLIAEEARRLTSARFSAVFLLEGTELTLSVFAGEPIPGLSVGHRSPVGESVAGLALQSGRPLLIEDMHNDPRVPPAARSVTELKSVLVVPLLIDSRSIGVILVTDKSSGALGPDDERVLSMLAASAVIQLENARLLIQAQQVATVEERQRLARELHDAVTQTLFSASLIAEVLPRIWERDPEEGRRRLDELRQLTRGALAEMRTLLLELRPAALRDTEMGDLLRQLADSIIGRARIPVSLEVEGECDLPAQVKVALYRIAQEALNNVTKHAWAEEVEVSLRCHSEQVTLSIHDNGRGFDLNSKPPESLGIGIMRERAEAIGATLEIESQRDQGTRLTVAWQGSSERSFNGTDETYSRTAGR